MRAAILVTPDRCTACRGCQIQCKNWNQLPAEKTTNRGTYENPPDLSFNTYNRIRFLEKEESPVEWFFFSQRCFHCTDAACKDVCPVDAIYHGKQGNVVIDQKKCIGCTYCVQSCPFEIPRYSEAAEKTNKCHLCFDRIANSLEPACTPTCPTDGLQFGERDELVDLGKERVTKLKEKGHKDASLYGEKDLGGLGVIYALPEKPEFFGLPESPSYPASATFWQIMKPIGIIGGGVTLLGIVASLLRNVGYEEEHKGGER